MESILNEVLNINNILAVVFLVTLILQHQRSKQREELIFGHFAKMTDLLSRCQEEIAERVDN